MYISLAMKPLAPPVLFFVPCGLLIGSLRNVAPQDSYRMDGDLHF